MALPDRTKVRKALCDEIKRNAREELDQLESEGCARLQAETADGTEKRCIAQARERMVATPNA
ncbi:MAG: hypothetical protein AAGF27_06980 [Pseudomonadota bacterium]